MLVFKPKISFLQKKMIWIRCSSTLNRLDFKVLLKTFWNSFYISRPLSNRSEHRVYNVLFLAVARFCVVNITELYLKYNGTCSIIHRNLRVLYGGTTGSLWYSKKKTSRLLWRASQTRWNYAALRSLKRSTKPGCHANHRSIKWVSKPCWAKTKNVILMQHFKNRTQIKLSICK